jgi:hypothetical protein
MPNPRNLVKVAHERFVVNDFLSKFNRRHHCNYKVLSEPNPPEAIISTGKTTSWVEVTIASWSDEFLQDQFSYATQGETHRPIKGNVFSGMTEQFANRFADVVKKKFEKKTYIAARDKYGPGYLIVSIQNPFFSGRDLSHMQKAWSRQAVSDLGCFRSVYLHFRTFNDYGLLIWRYT